MTKYNGIYPVVRKENSFSAKEYPVVKFLPGLDVLFVREQGGVYEYLRDKDLPSDADGLLMYQASLQNLSEIIDYSIVHTPYGGFAIFSDDEFEASALLFKQIWTMCAEKLADDLFVLAPANNTVLFIPKNGQGLLQDMLDHGKSVYDLSAQKISLQLYVFSREKEVLESYEEQY
ncbi:hypothetical protein M2150_001166 [Lachnospiraceae bacterium PM6-15]|uniref:hypothetical protein n=1 Tax=Ohessyouella blattaphilus TaxID=2949333 RepID=UPI003E2D5123